MRYISLVEAPMRRTAWPAVLFSLLFLLCPPLSAAVDVPLSNGRLALAIEVPGAELAGAGSVRGVPGAAWQGEGRVVLELRASYRHPSGSAPRQLSPAAISRAERPTSSIVVKPVASAASSCSAPRSPAGMTIGPELIE